MVVDDLIHDEAEEFLAEGWIEASRIGEGTKASDLHALTVRISGRKPDLCLVFADAFGDLEALSEHMDERRIDVVDAVATFTEYLIIVHPRIVPSQTIHEGVPRGVGLLDTLGLDD